MEVQKAKRLAPFLYYIPAILIIFFEVLIPHYVFLLLIVPYFALTFYLVSKTPVEDRTNVDYLRLTFLTIAHITLYILMFWR
ncbi:MAG: hypothetical protein ACJAT1_002322 [Marivirga sp.]|jgi:hypothetical protein